MDYKDQVIRTISIVYNYSNPFTLTYDNVAHLNVTSPNGGEYWNQGTSHAITWLSNNFLVMWL